MIDDNIEHLIELRGVYDGWSIAVLKDGTMKNRWANESGAATPGYERRFTATDAAIKQIEKTHAAATAGGLDGF